MSARHDCPNAPITWVNDGLEYSPHCYHVSVRTHTGGVERTQRCCHCGHTTVHRFNPFASWTTHGPHCDEYGLATSPAERVVPPSAGVDP